MKALAAFKGLSQLESAEKLHDMFAAGMTRDQVCGIVGCAYITLKERLHKARSILGHDLPGEGSRGVGGKKPSPEVRMKQAKLDEATERCPHCRLLLPSDGACIDCPGDPAFRRELMLSRRANGGARLLFDK